MILSDEGLIKSLRLSGALGSLEWQAADRLESARRFSSRTALSYLDLSTLYDAAQIARREAFACGAGIVGDPGYMQRSLAENIIGIIDAIRQDGLDYRYGEGRCASS